LGASVGGTWVGIDALKGLSSTVIVDRCLARSGSGHRIGVYGVGVYGIVSRYDGLCGKSDQGRCSVRGHGLLRSHVFCAYLVLLF
jgi:hypothetical protein